MPLHRAAFCRELVAWATMAGGRFRRAHQPLPRPLFEFLVYLPPAQRVKKTRGASERSIFRLMRGPSRIAPSQLSFAWRVRLPFRDTAVAAQTRYCPQAVPAPRDAQALR